MAHKITALLGAVALGWLAAAGPVRATEPITIGAQIPLTGASSELGQGFDYGAV